MDFVIDTDTFVQNELYYWRKHHDLHGWMEELYRAKGGAAEEFNSVNVELTLDDLVELEKAVRRGQLPHTTGFFFGDNPPDEESVKDDLQFVNDAKSEIAAGRKVYYFSSW